MYSQGATKSKLSLSVLYRYAEQTAIDVVENTWSRDRLRIPAGRVVGSEAKAYRVRSL